MTRELVEHFEYEEPTGSNRVNISATTGGLYVEITNDWYGDSDSGFGATLHLHLSIDDAKTLSTWLGKYFAMVKP